MRVTFSPEMLDMSPAREAGGGGGRAREREREKKK